MNYRIKNKICLTLYHLRDGIKVCKISWFISLLLLCFISVSSFAQEIQINEQENLLSELNSEFIRFLILEQAIEVVELVYESNQGIGWETKEKISHDFGMRFDEIEKEHERLRILFGNTPLYKDWRLNCDRLFQEGLTRAGLNEFQMARRNKLFRQKAAILSAGVGSVENPSITSVPYWTGGYMTPAELSYERIYAIRTLDVLKDRRAFDLFMQIAFGKGNLHEDEVKSEALLALGKNLEYWTQSQLRELIMDIGGSQDPLLQLTREEAQKLIDSDHTPLPENISHLSQNYYEMTDGMVELPIYGAKRLIVDPLNHPLQVFSIPTRILNGIYQAFIQGIGGIPEGVMGLSTGGAYGYAGKELGHQVITTALISVPSAKMARGMKTNGNLWTQRMRSQGPGFSQVGGSPLSGGSIFPKADPHSINPYTPNLTPEISWGKPSFEMGTSINTARNGSPSTMATLEVMPETQVFSVPNLQLGQATFEPYAPPTTLIPVPQKPNFNSNIVSNIIDMSTADISAGLQEDPQNLYWITVALGNSDFLDSPQKNKKRVFVIRKNSKGEITGYFIKDIEGDQDLNSIKTSVYDEVYASGGSQKNISKSDAAPQGSSGTSTTSIDIHQIKLIDDVFPSYLRHQKTPVRVISLGTGMGPLWEKVLEDRFGVQVTGIERDREGLPEPFKVTLSGGMHYETDYHEFSPEKLYDVVILNYPNTPKPNPDIKALIESGQLRTLTPMYQNWFLTQAKLIQRYLKPGGIAILLTEAVDSNLTSDQVSDVMKKFFGADGVHIYDKIEGYQKLGLNAEEIKLYYPDIGCGFFDYSLLVKDILNGKFVIIKNPIPDLSEDTQLKMWRTHNPNAKIPSDKYPFGHARTWALVQDYMGETFRDHVKMGPKDAMTIDVGSGLGLGLVQASQELYIHGVAINAQDMWPKIYAYDVALSQMTRDELEAEAQDLMRGSSVYGIRKPELGMFLEATGRMHPLISTDLMDDLQGAVHDVVKMHRKQVEAGEFKYRVGYAEEILPFYEGQVYTLYDLFGAFFYSPDRHTLLEQYYNALDADGKTYVYIGGDELYGIHHEVITKKGRISLYDYLTQKFPNIFSVLRPNERPVRLGVSYKKGQVLVIQRDPNIQSLQLGLDIEEIQIIQIPQVEGLEIPKVLFRESEP